MKRGCLLLLAAVWVVRCGGHADEDANGGTGGASAGASGSSAGAAGVGGGAGASHAGSGGSTIIDSGSSDVTAADVTLPPGQNILFEVSHENYAWAPKLEGIFITADGAVYSYDYFATPTDANYGPVVIFPATEQELRARYGENPQQTGSVPVSELMARFALVQAAASGVLLGEYSCADYGEDSFLGYLYDAASARYSRVILELDGDHAAKNISPAAGEIVSWLKQIAGSSVACEFTGAVCVGAVCNALPPSCPSGQVPSVVNGCWGECVPVTRCLEVPDCSVCGSGGVACATSTTGSHHCVQMYCQSADVCACSFAPPCAGGAEYCTNTGQFQVQCGP